MKRRIIYFLIFSFLIFASAYSQDSGGAKQTAANGGDLSGYTTQVIIDAKNDCGKGEESAYNALQGELDRRESEEIKGINLAKQAESELCDAVQSYQEALSGIEEIKKEFNEKAKELSSISDKIQSFKERNAAIAEQKKIVKEKYEAICTAADNVTKAYEQLGENYKKYGVVGDPVRLSDGSFLAEYVDFTAQDFLKKFSVCRNYKADGFSESFGKNWTCSLDTRIIRCLEKDTYELILLLKNMLLIYEQAAGIFTKYNELWPGYGQDTILKVLGESNTEVKAITDFILELEEINKNRERLTELNSLVTYGRYEVEDSYSGYPELLKFFDEEGNENILFYQGGGAWKSLSPISFNSYTLYSLDEKRNVEDSVFCTRGYKLVYRDRSEKYFSKYGILEREIDRNGNETIYISENGLITQIKNKTGESINIKRDEKGLITSITGNASGQASFTYSNDFLINVIDCEGISLGYSYDSDGDITQIIKSDGSCVSISYDINTYSDKKRCVSITNENGSAEFFNYSADGKDVKHYLRGGAVEEYKLNENGNTVWFKDEEGSITEFDVDELGLIKSQKSNGRERVFFYSDCFDVELISDNYGGEEIFTYNPEGFVVKHSDADGVSESYSYDEKSNVIGIYYCGDLVSSLLYYPNGLIKTVSEEDIEVDYDYNVYGSVIRRQENHLYNRSLNKTENWTYNRENKLILYTDNKECEISYEYKKTGTRNSKIIECQKNIKRTDHYMDSRNREFMTVETDLKNGVSITVKRLFDNCGNIVKILVNDFLFAEYSYAIDGKLISYVVWNNCEDRKYVLERYGIRTSYEYNDNGFLIKEERSIVGSSDVGKRTVKRCEYEVESGKKIVKVFYGEINPYVCEYDQNGRLQKEIYPDGYSVCRGYSKAGRLKTILDSNQNLREFSYKSDGGTIVFLRNSKGLESIYTYDSKGLLKEYKDCFGGGANFTYDSYGNETSYTAPGIRRYAKYDLYGRKVSFDLSDASGKSYYHADFVYDSESSEKTVFVDGKEYSKVVMDAWNRILCSEDINGKDFYEYDCIGNCIAKKNTLGQKICFEYAPDGNVIYISYPDGRWERKKYLSTGECVYEENTGEIVLEAEYNLSGKLTKVRNEIGNETTYRYSKEGLCSELTNYDTGSKNIFYGYSEEGESNFVAVSSNRGSFRAYLDENRLICKEKNQLGRSQVYKYDNLNRLIEAKNFSGRVDRFTYERKSNSTWTNYGNGEISLIQNNPLSLYERLEMNEYVTKYEFNSGGKMSRLIDTNLDFDVLYFYDNYGRCVEKKNDVFDVVYSYDELGRVYEIAEKTSGEQIRISYDELSYSGNSNYRVSGIEFSDGTKEELGFDKLGNQNVSLLRNKNEFLISGSFVLRDKNGKVSVSCDKNGSFRKYGYDKDGRLVSCVYPWTREILDFNYSKLYECGVFIQDYIQDEELISLDEEATWELKELFEKSKVEVPAGLGQNQNCWIEYYSYDVDGNLLTLTNPLGTIVYDYDAMNRIEGIHGANTKKAGLVCSWDDDGNLLSVDSALRRVDFAYGALNRPVRILEENKITGNKTFTEYCYDALGRRIRESKNGTDEMAYVYDGYSSDVIYVTPVMKNGYSAYDSIRDNLPTDFEYFGQNANDYMDEKGYRSDEYLFDYQVNDEYRFLTEDYSQWSNPRLEENGYLEKLNQKTMNITYEQRPYSTISLAGSPLCHLYRESKNSLGLEKEILYIDEKTNYSLTLDEEGEIVSKNEFDIWGNLLTGNKNISYAGANGLLKTDFEMLDFGLRDYAPLLNSFTTMDPSRSGSNWFVYSSCDPVNYRDNCGLYKEGLTDEQKANYAAAIAGFAKYNSQEMWETKSWNGMPIEFNCAEVSSFIDYIANMMSGVESTSEMERQFKYYIEKGDYTAAANMVCSAYIYSDTEGRNGLQTSDKLSDLRNPQILTPGTILVWAPDCDNPNPRKQTSTGHTLTVIARKFDSEGNVIGFTYMEGHLNVNKLTELDYCSIDGSYKKNDISYWRGLYQGTYELNGANTSLSCER